MAGWDDMALVGRIARPHGIRGQLIVNLETDFPEDRFQPGAQLFVRRAGVVEAVTVTTVRFQQERPVIGLQGIEDMDAALGLAGAELRVPPDQLMPLPDGVFYQHDLVDCVVSTRTGQVIGTVREVEGAAGAQRLVVLPERRGSHEPGGIAGGDEDPVLIPLAVDICVSIEPAVKRIVIDPPAGLIELNAPDPRGSRAERRAAARRQRKPATAETPETPETPETTAREDGQSR